MSRYILSEKADQDVERLFIYGIKEFGLLQAEKYMEGLIERLDKILCAPSLWPEVEVLGKPYRRSVYVSHSIYYRVEGDDIFVVRILGHEDPGRNL